MDNKNHTSEVSLQELVLALLKNWIIIVLCTAISLLSGAVYVFLIVQPVYQSSISGTIKVPEKANTVYGTYFFPSTAIMEYIDTVTSDKILNDTIKALQLDTTAETLRTQVTAAPISGKNKFAITAIAETPENARTLVSKLSEILVNHLGITYRRYAIESFIDDYVYTNAKLMETLNLEKLHLAALQAEAASIPELVTLKSLLVTNPELAFAVAYNKGLDLSKVSSENMVLYEESINPDYTSMQRSVFTAKQEVEKARIQKELNDARHNKLLVELDGVKKYQKTGDSSGLLDETLDVLGPNITLTSEASLSTSSISQKKALTLAIALVFGLMLGAALALLKHFWKENRIAKE